MHLAGKGLGGRNQELALAAAPGLSGLENTALISVGSDGTDGPTDAAGGYADGETLAALRCAGLDIDGVWPAMTHTMHWKLWGGSSRPAPPAPM